MKCSKCGAELLDTDTFCVNCGQKVEKISVCPSCGEALREGEKFCHKCGTMIYSGTMDDEIPVTQQKTTDIPFDMIEQGLLMEAEHAIGKRSETGNARGAEEERPISYRQPVQQERPISYGQPMQQERPVREQPRRRPRQYDAYDDYDDSNEDGSKMKVVTIILGIIIAAVVLVIAYILWSQNSTSKYKRKGEDTEQDSSAGTEDEEQDSEDTSEDDLEIQGRLQVISNVNIRNKPTTEGSDVLMVAKKGDTYQYYELIDDSWYHIQLDDGTEGYVSKKYVEDLE